RRASARGLPPVLPESVARSTRLLDCRGMPRLRQRELGPTGDFERGHQAKARVLDGLDKLDTFGPQLFNRRVDVVAHQVQLVEAGCIGWMNTQLGRRQRKDQPP